MERQQIAQEALTRAVTGQTMSNYQAIFDGFLAKGIPEDDIKPRENIFTYHAWRALGRQVKRGEHGVKVVTYRVIEVKGEEDEDGKPRTIKRPWYATVFHFSQTEPLEGENGTTKEKTQKRPPAKVQEASAQTRGLQLSDLY